MQVSTLLRRISDLVIEVRQLKGENEALRERNKELERIEKARQDEEDWSPSPPQHTCHTRFERDVLDLWHKVYVAPVLAAFDARAAQ